MKYIIPVTTYPLAFLFVRLFVYTRVDTDWPILCWIKFDLIYFVKLSLVLVWRRIGEQVVVWLTEPNMSLGLDGVTVSGHL